MQPLCESYLGQDQLNQMEPFYPLHACMLTGMEIVMTEVFNVRAYDGIFGLIFLVGTVGMFIGFFRRIVNQGRLEKIKLG